MTSRGERGSSLIEVMVASAILVTLMAGLMSLAGVAINTTENQGHLAARTTEYAQDKMEQLLALAYNDTTSDTRVFPAASTGGTGLNLTPGGSSDPAHPMAGYVDYLDQKGNLCGAIDPVTHAPIADCPAPSGTTPPAGWFYQRVWQISTPTGTTRLKQITVAATVARGFGGGNKALAVLTVLKTSPF